MFGIFKEVRELKAMVKSQARDMVEMRVRMNLILEELGVEYVASDSRETLSYLKPLPPDLVLEMPRFELDEIMGNIKELWEEAEKENTRKQKSKPKKAVKKVTKKKVNKNKK